MPCPTPLLTEIAPLWASTMALQMASPRPVPPRLRDCDFSRWKKLSKMCGRSFSAMPIPVSTTEITALPARRSQDSVIWPPGSVKTAAQAAAPSLPGMDNPFSNIESKVRNGTGNDPEALKNAAVSAMRAAVTGDAAQQKDAQEKAAQALAKAQNIPVEQARTQVADYTKQFNDTVAKTKEQAKQAAQDVGQHMQESATEAAQQVKEKAQDATSTVKDEAQGAAQDVKQSAQGAAQDVKDQTQQHAEAVRSGSGSNGSTY